MHRLTHLEHEVVGHVGEEVDRAHAAVEQADSHIHGTDRTGTILELQAGVTVAQRILNIHIDLRQLVKERQIV